jgi:diguanylate cyclase (GGDEF)-like protein/PAS domain S-box-containing protein
MSEKLAHPAISLGRDKPTGAAKKTVNRDSQVAPAMGLTADNGIIKVQALIDILPDYFYIKDLESRFVIANKSLAANNGFLNTSDLVGLSDADIHPPEIAEKFHAEEEEIIRTGLPIIGRVERIVEAGVEKWFSSTKFPLRDTRNEIIGLLGIAHDISEMIRGEVDLYRAQTFWHSVVENVPDAIVVKDVHTRRYTMMNHAAEKLIGTSRSYALGKTAADIYPAAYAELIRLEDDLLLETGELTIDNHEMFFHKNEPRIVVVTRKLLLNERGEPQFMLAVLHDITERKRAEERVAYLAQHDTLTGLPNRAVFNERLNKAIDRAKARNAQFAVLAIDLDRLKEVNDMFGHAAGDHLITEVASRFCAASTDAFVARIGGDEFAVVAENADTVANLVRFTDRLNEFVSREMNIEGAKYCPSISVGIAVFPNDGGDAKSLLANADAALYRAKAEGRSVSRFFERGMDMEIRDRRALRHDLHFAIERNEFAIHYQPKATMNGEIIGFEALLRWNHPTRGRVSPAEFIPAAEESRLIVEIGEWVLREVCKEACSWPLPLSVAVNLSPVQFQYGDLTNLVHSILLETGLTANRLALEITEGVLITDSTRALTVLRQLKAFGVCIVMDDFGKGYSSLSYLQLFPFDIIKIDRDFVHNVCQNHQSAAIVRAVLGLARALGLPVLAEGVETKEELEFLRALGCDEMQGYLIGRPGPIEQYCEVLGRLPDFGREASVLA